MRYTNQQPPQRGGAVPNPIWVGSKWLLAFPRVPVTPGTPLYFFAMLPTERPQKGSTQLLQNRSPAISLLLAFSCPFSSPHSSLLLMSGNVHPNPGPIFPCSVCAGNVTWRGKSVRCCTCSICCTLQFSSPNSELLAALTLGAAPLAVSLLETL